MLYPSPFVAILHKKIERLVFPELFPPPPQPALPVHTGVCSVVVEGSLRADAALLTLLPTVLRDGEGGATALAG